MGEIVATGLLRPLGHAIPPNSCNTIVIMMVVIMITINVMMLVVMILIMMEEEGDDDVANWLVEAGGTLLQLEFPLTVVT